MGVNLCSNCDEGLTLFCWLCKFKKKSGAKYKN